MNVQRMGGKMNKKRFNWECEGIVVDHRLVFSCWMCFKWIKTCDEITKMYIQQCDDIIGFHHSNPHLSNYYELYAKAANDCQKNASIEV